MAATSMITRPKSTHRRQGDDFHDSQRDENNKVSALRFQAYKPSTLISFVTIDSLYQFIRFGNARDSSELPVAHIPPNPGSVLNAEQNRNATTRLKTGLSQPLRPVEFMWRDSTGTFELSPTYKEQKAAIHQSCVDEMKTILSPVLDTRPDTCIVLLCHGPPNTCRVFPVKVKNHDQDIWKKLNQAWYENRGTWRKWIPYYQVRNIEIVDVAIKSSDPRQKSTFEGQFRLCKSLSQQETELEAIIAGPEDRGFGYHCNYDAKTDTWNHGVWSHPDFDVPCPENELSYEPCAHEKRYADRRELAKLRTQALWSSCFCNPGSMDNDNFLEDCRVLFSHRDLLHMINKYHCPRLYELPFKGLMIEEGWEFNMKSPVLPGIITCLFCAVVASRWIFGDWATAWNVGGFLIALVTLLMMWAGHVSSQ